MLKLLVDVDDVAHLGWLGFCDLRPVLNKTECFVLDVVVDAGRVAKDRDEVVHELTRSDFLKKVITAILYADVGEA